MPDTNQLVLLAEYNQLMNQRQYAAAAKLFEDELHEDKGAFFKSVIGTLNHILVGDIIWLKRFATHPSCCSALSYISGLATPKFLDEIVYDDLDALTAVRHTIDELIVKWIDLLSDEDTNACISYTNMAGKKFQSHY